jgi:hypothetical protein
MISDARSRTISEYQTVLKVIASWDTALNARYSPRLSERDHQYPFVPLEFLTDVQISSMSEEVDFGELKPITSRVSVMVWVTTITSRSLVSLSK